MTPVQLTAEHLGDMAQVHAAAFPKGEAWNEEAFRTLLNLPTTHAIGGWVEGQLASLIIVQFVAGDAEILTLATLRAFRRQGLAQALIDFLETDLGSEGIQKWMLEVAADNATAIKFYTNLGFAADGRRSNYYKRDDGKRIDAILMTKHLSGQARM